MSGDISNERLVLEAMETMGSSSLDLSVAALELIL